MNFTVTPGFAFSNWAPILSNASVSDVAANTTSVPEGFPDADELPEEEPPDDELHAASTSTAAAAQATVKGVTCRLCEARGERRPARALDRDAPGPLFAPMSHSRRVVTPCLPTIPAAHAARITPTG